MKHTTQHIFLSCSVVSPLLLIFLDITAASFSQHPSNHKWLQPSIHSRRTSLNYCKNYYYDTAIARGVIQRGRPHQINDLMINTTYKQIRISNFRLYSKDQQSNNDLLNTILSPFDNLWKIISFPIGGGDLTSSSTSIPLLYPLTILLFNIFFNNTTSLILDVLVGAFYLFIRQINISDVDEDNDEVETELLQLQPRILLDALVLFASITTALLISPSGFQTREIGVPAEYFIVSSFVVLVCWFSFFLSSNDNNIGSNKHDEVDPSQRLLDLWDEKFENKSKQKK